MRLGVLAGFAVVFAGGCAHEVPAPTPLYDAFFKYCVATGAGFEAVEKAVTADGGVRQDLHVEIVKITSTTWKRGDLLVSAGPAHRVKPGPDGKPVVVEPDPPGSKGEVCSVHLTDETDRSQALIAKWAGVPADLTDAAKRFGDDLNDKYRFRVEGGRHLPQGERAAAVTSGGAWFVLFWRRGKDTGVSLTHDYMP